MIIDELKKIISEKMDIDTSDITENSTLEDLKIDSLDAVEIIMDIEDKYDITIDSIDNIKTVGDIVKEVEKANN